MPRVSAPTGSLELLVIVGDAVHVLALPPSGAVTLGRVEGCDVRIDHPSVSRRHAVLHLGDPLRIEDLGGANGTFVRDLREPANPGETVPLRQITKQTAPIRLGDCVTLGSTTVVVRRAAGPGERSGDAGGPHREVIVEDPAVRAVYEQARLAAKTPISILLLGETGVGKDVLAHEIHRASSRANGPFVARNCAAFTETLLEAELFGHEKGAYTGAGDGKPGLFEAGSGGTVFLDEVGELSPRTQTALLRVIEDRQVLRVGGRTPRTVDVRFVFATNRDLEADVNGGRFRQDLLYRINGLILTLPPLRARPADLEPLARSFVAEVCKRFDRPQPPALSEEALAVLRRHRWPGNIRELHKVIERALVFCAGEELLPEHLPASVREAAPDAPPSDELEALHRQVEAAERQRVVDALAACAGNQTQAAALLGMSRRTLVDKLDKYKLPRPRKGE